MAPNKTGTKSTTPTGSASPGKQSVASNFSEVSLPEVLDDKSRAPSQMSEDLSDGGGSPALGALKGTPRSSSMRGESTMSRTSSGRSSVFGISPGNQFWKGLRPETEIFFVKTLDPRFECALCKNVLRYPTMMECGHHCCSGCMADIMRAEPRCPIDQRKIEKGQLSTDRNLQKEIETLFVRCSHVNGGCTWSGYLKQLAVHLETCNYQVIPCPNECVAEFERRFLKSHLSNDCPRRQIPCQYCKEPVQLDEMQPHFQDCVRFEIQCINQCGEKAIAREDMQNHLDTECMEQLAQCPFFDSGCPFEGKRKDLKAHVMDSPDIHFDMMIHALRTCSDALEIHDAILERQSDRLIDVENEAAVLEKLHGHQILWKIDNYSKRLKDAEEGVTLAVESPIFTLSRDGYRMQMSACLNGDGKASGKYMSLYVCLVKGEFDALLRWPFALQLSITLLDQNKNPTKRNDHVQSLRPNACVENMPFLKRPTGDRNPAFGLVRFIELEKFNEGEYVKNDAFYIRVKVDPQGIIKL